MNLIVGIDFSKQKFDVTAIFCEDLTETKPRICNQFANDLKGFKELAKWVKKELRERSKHLVLRRKDRYLQYATVFVPLL